jgi:hypothetical protein
MYHIFVAEIAREGRVKLLSIILIAQISPITGHLPSCKITHLAIPNKALTQGWTIETIQLSAIIHLQYGQKYKHQYISSAGNQATCPNNPTCRMQENINFLPESDGTPAIIDRAVGVRSEDDPDPFHQDPRARSLI